MRLSHDRVTSGTRPDNGLLRSHRSLRKRRADAQRLADLRRAHARPRASCSHQEARANELRIFLSSSTDRFVSVTIALASLARRRRLFVGIGQSPPANFQRTNYARRNRRALTDVDQRRCPSFSSFWHWFPQLRYPRYIARLLSFKCRRLRFSETTRATCLGETVLENLNRCSFIAASSRGLSPRHSASQSHKTKAASVGVPLGVTPRLRAAPSRPAR
jgi:hypothetical protein